jgi:hypothetical protein
MPFGILGLFIGGLHFFIDKCEDVFNGKDHVVRK